MNSTDEDPTSELTVESSAIINLRCVSTKLYFIICSEYVDTTWCTSVSDASRTFSRTCFKFSTSNAELLTRIHLDFSSILDLF